MNVQELLDAAKTKGAIPSDYALSMRLGVTKQAVSKWRLGQAAPDPVACEKLHVLSGIPLNRVLGIVGEARAISSDEKRVWRKLAAAMFVSAVLLPATSFAAQIPTNGSHDLDIMRNARCQLRKLLAWLASTLQPSQPCLAN